MITIEYTNEYLAGEPGPNFYWRGKPADYLGLIRDLHPLGIRNDVEICVNDLKNVKVVDGSKIIAKSTKEGRILCCKSEGLILIDLTCMIWRSIHRLLLEISFAPSHHYVEFDEADLAEDANLIISSEA